MKCGVNNNGIEWYLLDINTYLVYYYFGDKLQKSKVFRNVNLKFINRLTFEDLI